MAYIAPFRGLHYNPDKISDFSTVTTPPYDVISPAEQDFFYQASPYNMVRLELGKSTPEDSETDNPHTRATRFLQRWQEEKILVRDDQPAIYHYELDYSLSPRIRQTRYGFICVLRLEDFKEGGVRPHEKTFSKVKDERLRLMLSCHTNLSPVFALYPDPEQKVDFQLKSGRAQNPIIRFTDQQGMEHRMWRVTDLDTLRCVKDLMQDKAIFIADGHHRYETALNYRNIQRQRRPDAGPRAPFEYVMVYLSNMNDPGLTILPTHRMLRHLGSWNPEAFLKQAEAFFEISSYEATQAGQEAWQADLQAGHGRQEIHVGCYHQGAVRFHLLKPRPEKVDSYLAEQGFPAVLRQLHVVVLDQVILRHLLGLSEAFLADEHNIHFKHDLAEAISETQSGVYEAAFLLNPTRIEQVRDVAGAGLTMPHKSTYFYPKVKSGMIIHPLELREQIIW